GGARSSARGARRLCSAERASRGGVAIAKALAADLSGAFDPASAGAPAGTAIARAYAAPHRYRRRRFAESTEPVRGKPVSALGHHLLAVEKNEDRGLSAHKNSAFRLQAARQGEFPRSLGRWLRHRPSSHGHGAIAARRARACG